MTARFPPGDPIAVSAVALTGAAVLATLAWAHMSALSAAYGPICGAGAGLPHCPACYGAVGLLLLGLWSLTLAARRRLLPARS